MDNFYYRKMFKQHVTRLTEDNLTATITDTMGSSYLIISDSKREELLTIESNLPSNMLGLLGGLTKERRELDKLIAFMNDISEFLIERGLEEDNTDSRQYREYRT